MRLGCVGVTLVAMLVVGILGVIHQSLTSVFGEDAAAWMIIVIIGLGFIAMVISNAQKLANTNATVMAIVAHARQYPDEMGTFGEWYGSTHGPDADQMSIRSASKAVIKAYGGVAVVNHLNAEGFGQILFDDIADIFGSDRAYAVHQQVQEDSYSLPLTMQFVAFFLGAFLGYRATQRR